MICSQTELAAQKEALDTEHCRALETLKKQVQNHLYSTLVSYPSQEKKS